VEDKARAGATALSTISHAYRQAVPNHPAVDMLMCDIQKWHQTSAGCLVTGIPEENGDVLGIRYDYE